MGAGDRAGVRAFPALSRHDPGRDPGGCGSRDAGRCAGRLGFGVVVFRGFPWRWWAAVVILGVGVAACVVRACAV